MRSLVNLMPGPAWIEGEPAANQDPTVMGAHLARTRKLFDKGKVLFGGPHLDGNGGVFLLETETENEAQILMEGDPAVKAGIVTFKITPLFPFFDAFSGLAWSPPS